MQLLCLANSRKLHGRCLAGLKWPEMTDWIRPVSSSVNGTLSVGQASVYETSGNFREIELLDLIEVPLLETVPLPHHPENWLIDESSEISLIRRVPLVEVRDTLINHARSSGRFFGRVSFNSISSSDAQNGLNSSLELVHATNVRFGLNDYDSLRVSFDQLGDGRTIGNLPVTDLVFDQRFRIGSEISGNFLLTFSLGEEFREKHYVLNCGVIPLESDNF
jgi:hypothetical protein